MRQRFAQISDPHLSSLEGARAKDLCNKRALGYLSWRRRRRFEHRREVLDALQHDLRQFELDQLLVTGDLTHIGLPDEFEQARAWLRQLGEPADIALVPGNHDACVAAPWEETFALWREYMASDTGTRETGDSGLFPSLRVRGKIAFIGLSSGVPKPPLMATGTVDQAQLSRLPALLRDSAAQGLFRVVHLHHCPLPGQEKWRKRLTNAPAVQDILQEYGAELIVHGHGHRAHCHELDTRSGTTPVIAVPSASALGLHGADVASYNCYQVEPAQDGWRLEILSRHYQPQSGNFEAGQSRVLGLQRLRPEP